MMHAVHIYRWRLSSSLVYWLHSLHHFKFLTISIELLDLIDMDHRPLMGSGYRHHRHNIKRETM